jgi:hypothetical protein
MPVKAFIRLAEIIDEEAQRELHNPAAVRRKLEEVEEARVYGRASDEELAEVEGEAVGRLLPSVGTGRASRDGS